MAYARPDAAGTVVMQGPELSSRYFGICDGGATECLYGCLCPWCMAAQLKTELDGRPCGLCDCLCSSFPHNNIALRRQLRRKYGLELSVSTENCGCCACTGTYAQDCWVPAGTSWLASVFASTVPYFRDSGQLISNWAQSMMLCASVREMRKLSPPAPYGCYSCCPGARLLTSTRAYGGPAHPSHDKDRRSPYTTTLCGCCDDKGGNQCCYVFWCYPCAAGHAVAMLQERPCDFLDCLSSWGPYELRKTVQAKYGLHDPRDDCGDGCCAIFCGCCMVCQDYKELRVRQGEGSVEVQNLLSGASASSAISPVDDQPAYPPATYPAYPVAPTAPKM